MARYDPEIPNQVCDDESDVFYNIKQLPTGLPTGNWTRIPDPQLSGDGKRSFTLYDYKARPVRNHTSYPDNGYTTVDSRYNFSGAVLKQLPRIH